MESIHNGADFSENISVMIIFDYLIYSTVVNLLNQSRIQNVCSSLFG